MTKSKSKSKSKKTTGSKSGGAKKASTAKTKSVATASTSSKVSPFEPFQALRKQVDDLFTNFNGSWPHFEMPKIEWPTLIDAGTESAIAKFDLSENGKSVKVVADIPGVDEKDIEVLVEGGVLKIKGKKETEREEEKGDVYISERSFGSFSRAFRLPDGIDEEAVDASFDKGVLTVTLPKTAKKTTGARHVPVKRK